MRCHSYTIQINAQRVAVRTVECGPSSSIAPVSWRPTPSSFRVMAKYHYVIFSHPVNRFESQVSHRVHPYPISPLYCVIRFPWRQGLPIPSLARPGYILCVHVCMYMCRYLLLHVLPTINIFICLGSDAV